MANKELLERPKGGHTILFATTLRGVEPLTILDGGQYRVIFELFRCKRPVKAPNH